MPTSHETSPAMPNMFLDAMEALANHHGQLDIRLERLSLRLPFSGRSLELNGTVSVSVHLRELTEKERTALAAKQVRSLTD
jgi:hypothetical protein